MIVQRVIEFFENQGVGLEVLDYWGTVRQDKALTDFGFVEAQIKGTVSVNPKLGLCGGMFICKLRKFVGKSPKDSRQIN